MTASRLDIPQAERFLRDLGAPRVLVAIHPDNGTIRAATPRDKATLAAFLQSASGDGMGLYFTVNRARPLKRKPLKADIRFFDFAQTDLDPADAVTDLESWQKQVRAKLRASACPPNIIWASGNGVQALWRIREPVLLDSPATIADCEARNKGLLEAFADERIKADGTWNIDRVLRIPGTPNFPNAKKRAAGRTIRNAGNVEIL